MLRHVIIAMLAVCKSGSRYRCQGRSGIDYKEMETGQAESADIGNRWRQKLQHETEVERNVPKRLDQSRIQYW